MKKDQVNDSTRFDPVKAGKKINNNFDFRGPKEQKLYTIPLDDLNDKY